MVRVLQRVEPLVEVIFRNKVCWALRTDLKVCNQTIPVFKSRNSMAGNLDSFSENVDLTKGRNDR